MSEATGTADLLNDVLESLRIDSSALHVFEFTAPWGVRIHDFPQAFSWTVVEGRVWMKMASGETLHFDTGDTFVLARGTAGKAWDVSSALGVPMFPAGDLWRAARLPAFEPGQRAIAPHALRWGGGGARTRVVSTAFAFEDRSQGPLIDALPDLLVVRGDDAGSSFVDLLLQFPASTGAATLPGFAALATQTARLLLVHVVRTYALSRQESHGWLRGLADPRMARALACIHREPARAWTVAELAQASGLSRSVFAQRFQQVVGDTPMHYLCAWRMHLAREALTSGRATITTVARDMGYQSEAAFRAAFRRMTGQQPREFRRNWDKRQR